MSHMRQLNVCGDVQVVTEPLWDAAATAYFHLGDMAGMQAAWSWAQTHPAAHSWVPSSPDCYMFLATALTQLYEPMEGTTSCCLLGCQNVLAAHDSLFTAGNFAGTGYASLALYQCENSRDSSASPHRGLLACRIVSINMDTASLYPCVMVTHHLSEMSHATASPCWTVIKVYNDRRADAAQVLHCWRRTTSRATLPCCLWSTATTSSTCAYSRLKLTANILTTMRQL